MKNILCVVGTRPEAIKMFPVYNKIKKNNDINVRLLFSGQHRDLLRLTLPLFETQEWDELDLMRPNQSLGQLTGRAFSELDEYIKRQPPDMILAQGDTTTVMVTSVVAFYHGVPFGHVEAGLRTRDLRSPFPEELNRVIAGRLATVHFAPTAEAVRSLLVEGVPRAAIHLTGNTVIDALAERRSGLAHSAHAPCDGGRLLLVTAHRRENLGPALEGAFSALRRVVEARPDVHILYPIHPNPNVREVAGRTLGAHPRISLIEPLGYLEFLAAMEAAYAIITDSGGVQEEAPYLRKPVLVLRKVTERPEAVQAGVAKLVGTAGPDVEREVLALLDDPSLYQAMANGGSPYGDGRASERIAWRVRASIGLSNTGPAPDEFSG